MKNGKWYLIFCVLFALYCVATGYEPGCSSVRFGVSTCD